MQKAHPHCTIYDKDNDSEEIKAGRQSTELSGNTVSQDDVEFWFPLCPKTYKLIKRFQNHCSTKHR